MPSEGVTKFGASGFAGRGFSEKMEVLVSDRRSRFFRVAVGDEATSVHGHFGVVAGALSLPSRRFHQRALRAASRTRTARPVFGGSIVSRPFTGTAHAGAFVQPVGPIACGASDLEVFCASAQPTGSAGRENAARIPAAIGPDEVPLSQRASAGATARRRRGLRQDGCLDRRHGSAGRHQRI
jgi:hypothetical protein